MGTETEPVLKLLKQPNEYPFFYGWVIVVVATIGTLASIPGQTIGVGVFTDALIVALSIDRLSLSISYGIGTVCSSFCLPYAGVVLDRIGARWMSVLSSLGLGIALIGLAFVDRILFGASKLIGIEMGTESFRILIIIGAALFFFLIRFTGQGCLTLVSRYVIGKWFNHRRGFATMISGILIGIGFNSSPEYLNMLIRGTNWWVTLLILAGLIGIGMSLIGWLFFRDNPEDEGLEMDGGWEGPKDIHDDLVIYHEFTRKEALSTYCFWIYVVAFSLHAMVATAFGFHVADMADEFFMTREAVYTVYIPMGFAGVIGTIFSGWISDRIPLRFILIFFCVSIYLGCLGTIFYDQTLGRYLIIGGFGIGNGIFINLITLTFPRYFGRKHLGAISGFNTFAIVFASATGPLLFSTLKDLLHSYSMVMFLTLIIPTVLVLMAAFIKNPQYSYAPEVAS